MNSSHVRSYAATTHFPTTKPLKEKAVFAFALILANLLGNSSYKAGNAPLKNIFKRFIINFLKSGIL
jgi:hypothetical protein